MQQGHCSLEYQVHTLEFHYPGHGSTVSVTLQEEHSPSLNKNTRIASTAFETWRRSVLPSRIASRKPRWEQEWLVWEKRSTGGMWQKQIHCTMMQLLMYNHSDDCMYVNQQALFLGLGGWGEGG